MVLLLLAARVQAQANTAPPSPPTPEAEEEEEPEYLALADTPAFLPRSYLYWGSPVGSEEARAPLIFALSYALHLAAFNNLRERALHGGRWAGAATLSFEGDLRMLNEPSTPVRMPSYRPAVSGQLFYILPRAAPMVFSARAILFHYSNGQERCTFDESQSDNSPACEQVLSNVKDPQAELNRMNGNFSMNGWGLELYGRVHQLSVKRVAIGQLAFGVSVAGNLPLGNISMEPGLRRLYGWGRLGAELDARKRMGWASLGARAAVAYFPKSGPDIPSASGLVEMTLGPYWLAGFGFFARYYGGRDFYNAFFVDSIQQFTAGLSWDGERPLKFAEAKKSQ
ncbi:MAG TPA: hypothetical protein VFZ61_15235 [Polyangiales bacterium]